MNDPDDATICASFRKEGEWTVTSQYSMHPKEARQLEKSLSNPTYEENSLFALQSGEMVKIFLMGETHPTFQMTTEGANDFQEKLSEKLRSLDEFRQARGLSRTEEETDGKQN